MGENDIQLLYSFLQDEGYDVSSIDNFKSALSNDGTRRQVYDFFTEEGFDMGNFDNFKYYPPSNVPMPQQRQPLPQGIAAPASQQPTLQQQMVAQGRQPQRAPMPEPKIPDLRPQIEAARVARTEERRQPQAQPQVRDFDPAFSRYLNSYFELAPENLRARFDRDENLTERERAELVGNAISQYGRQVASDFKALRESVDPELARQGVALNAQLQEISNRINAGEQGLEGQLLEVQDQLSALPQDVTDFINVTQDYAKVIEDAATFMDRFPNEKERLAGIRQEILDSRGGGTLQAVENAVKNAKNRVFEWAGGLLMTAKGIGDTALEAVGVDTGQYRLADRAAESIQNWYQDKVKSYMDTQVFEGGEFKPENLPQAVAGVATDMALLLGGAGAASRVGGLSRGAGLVASGYATTFGNFYQNALEEGLDPTEALTYAHGSAFAQGMLELVSPNALIAGGGVNFRNVLRAVKSGEIAAKDVVKSVLREIGDENIQELTQALAEKSGNLLSNELFESDFTDTMSRDELLETVTLTTIATGFMAGVRGRKNLQGDMAANLAFLRDNQREFEDWLTRELEAGRVTRDEAQKAAEYIDGASQPDVLAQSIVDETEPSEEFQVAQELLSPELETQLQDIESILDEIEGQAEAPVEEATVEAVQPTPPQVAQAQAPQPEAEQPASPQSPEPPIEPTSPVGEPRAQRPQGLPTDPEVGIYGFQNDEKGYGFKRQGDNVVLTYKGKEVEDSERGIPKELRDVFKPSKDPLAPARRREVVKSLYAQPTARPAVEQAVEGAVPVSEPQTVMQADTDVAGGPVQVAGPMAEPTVTEPVAEPGVEGAVSEPATAVEEPVVPADVAPSLQTFEMQPTKEIQKDDVVEYDGKLWVVTKSGKEYDLVSYGVGLAVAKGVTRDEIKASYRTNVADRRAKLEQAKSALKDAANQFYQMRAVFDPKNEGELQAKLVLALQNYISSWIKYNGSLAYSNFKRSLPARLANVIPDAQLRSLFQDSEEYKSLKDIQERAKQRQAETNLKPIGVTQKVSKGAAQVVDTKTNLADEVKDEVKKKGLKYWVESRDQTDAQAQYWISEVGLDAAVDAFLKQDASLPEHVQMFVGRNLMFALNDAGQFDKAVDVALEFTRRGREMGRGLGAFVGLTLLTPEGLQIAMNRMFTDAKDKLAERYKTRVEKSLRKYEQAQRRAAEKTVSNLKSIGPDRTWVKDGLERARKELLQEVRGSLSSGLNPNVVAKAVKFGVYLILDGAVTFEKWAGRFKQQFKNFSDKQLEEIWNTKYNAATPLRDVAQNALLQTAIKKFLNSPSELQAFLDNAGFYGAVEIAEKLHSAYRTNLVNEFKKVTGPAERAIVEIIEKGSDLDANTIREVYIANNEFVGLDDEVKEKLSQVNDILRRSPVQRQKQVAIAELMALAFRKLGKVPVGDYMLLMFYGNMLFGADTHMTNIFGAATQASSDILQASILRPFFGSTGRSAAISREAARAARFGVKVGAKAAKDVMKRGKGQEVNTNKYPTPDLAERYTSIKEAVAQLKSISEHMKKGEVRQGWTAFKKGMFGLYAVPIKYSFRALAAEDLLIRTPVQMSYMVTASEELAAKEVQRKGTLYDEVFEQYQDEIADLYEELIRKGTDARSVDRHKKVRQFIQVLIADRIRGWKMGEIETYWQAKIDEVRKLYEQTPVPSQDEIKAATVQKMLDDNYNGIVLALGYGPKILKESGLRALQALEMEVGEKLSYAPDELLEIFTKDIHRFNEILEIDGVYDLWRELIDGDVNTYLENNDIRAEVRKKFNTLVSTDLFQLGPMAKEYTDTFSEMEQSLVKDQLEFTEEDVIAGAMERFPNDFRVYDISTKVANRSVFNYPPEGMMGAFAAGLNSIMSDVPLLRTLVPFTNLLANVFNAALDYIPPIALSRLFDVSPSAINNRVFGTALKTTGVKGAGAYTRDIDMQLERRAQLITRGLVGMATMTLAAMVLGGGDEDGFPILTGGGPSDYAKKKQLQEKGWKPYSIRVGDTYVSYQNIPVAAALSFVGNYFDLERYGTKRQKEDAFLYATAKYPGFLMNYSFLSGLADFINDIVDDKNKAIRLNLSLPKRIGATVGNFVPYVNLAMDIEKGLFPDQPWTMGERDAVGKIPFVRRAIDRPMIDSRGRVIGAHQIDNKAFNALFTTLGGERFFQPPKELDKVDQVFMQKGYFMPSIRLSEVIEREGIGPVELAEDPELFYDVQLVTGRLFDKAIKEQIDGLESLEPEQFKKAVSDLYSNFKSYVKDQFSRGKTAKDLIGELPY